MTRIISQLKNTITTHEMLAHGDSVLVGLSGGADSVCLIHVLHELKSELNITLAAAHLNHGIRGAEADSDEQFCADLCAKLGIEFYRKTVSLVGSDLESAGRTARYEYFADLKREHNFDKIATAHNADDQAETVLMRILRGTGISGLAGIRYTRDDGVIRPILDVSRTEIKEYLRTNNLDWRTDKTNADTGFTRNRIRAELLPYLESNFNPNVREALQRLVSTAGEDGEFLENYARRLYKRLKNPLPTNEICLHIDSLALIERPIAVRLVRIAAQDALGVFPQLENKHIDDIFALATTAKSGTSLDLPNDLRVAVNYGWLTFSNRNEIEMFGEFHLEIKPNQTYDIKKYGLRITSQQLNYNDYAIEKYDTFIDIGKLSNRKLHLRKRQDGDRMAVFADGRTKKINDIFTDMKISRADRDRQLILVASLNEGPGNVPAAGSADSNDGHQQTEKVAAILGVRVSENFRADLNTKEGILIRYEHLENLDN